MLQTQIITMSFYFEFDKCSHGTYEANNNELNCRWIECDRITQVDVNCQNQAHRLSYDFYHRFFFLLSISISVLYIFHYHKIASIIHVIVFNLMNFVVFFLFYFLYRLVFLIANCDFEKVK